MLDGFYTKHKKHTVELASSHAEGRYKASRRSGKASTSTTTSALALDKPPVTYVPLSAVQPLASGYPSKKAAQSAMVGLVAKMPDFAADLLDVFWHDLERARTGLVTSDVYQFWADKASAAFSYNGFACYQYLGSSVRFLTSPLSNVRDDVIAMPINIAQIVGAKNASSGVHRVFYKQRIDCLSLVGKNNTARQSRPVNPYLIFGLEEDYVATFPSLYPSVDGAIFLPSRQTIVFVQITTAKTHSMKTEGMNTIKSAMGWTSFRKIFLFCQPNIQGRSEDCAGL
ncbi:hypothetical protein JCM10295v2_004731 [Rhodotorula toruloides]